MTWRSRSRSARSASSQPGSKPSVASTSAASSRRRASSVAAPRVSSSYRFRAAAELAPCDARLSASPELLLAAVRVEHVELVRGPGEPALLELARHRDQPLGCGREVLAGDRTPPRVGARTPVGEHATCENEAGLVLGRELGESRELLVLEEPLRYVELGLDVCLAGGGADRAGVALRAEQEPDRLREDRLARAGLAGDRRQPGGRRELSLPDEDEVLDPEATKQRSGGSG